MNTDAKPLAYSFWFQQQLDEVWFPVLWDTAQVGQLRLDYPDECAGRSDNLVLEYFAPLWQRPVELNKSYKVEWDSLTDAYQDYSRLADAFFELARRYDTLMQQIVAAMYNRTGRHEETPVEYKRSTGKMPLIAQILLEHGGPDIPNAPSLFQFVTDETHVHKVTEESFVQFFGLPDVGWYARNSTNPEGLFGPFATEKEALEAYQLQRQE